MKIVKTVLLGLGTVNIGLLKILIEKNKSITDDHQLKLLIIGVADSSGIAINDAGFAYETLISLKTAKAKVSDLAGFIPEIPTKDITDQVEADLLVEASPVNLDTGDPGLAAVRSALAKGWSVVCANKAPLVLAYDELHRIAKKQGSQLAFSATVCGGLPVVNVLQRDLRLAKLIRLEGIFNVTSNFVLAELEKGRSFKNAIAEAQRIGAAETDPSLDIEGYDTANKLYIIMKSFTNFSGEITDIERQGIEYVDQEAMEKAMQRNHRIKLVASAEYINSDWQLSVKPTEVKANSFLGNCEGWEMGVRITTDYYEEIAMKTRESEPVGTSAAVLRDIINIFA